MRWERLFDDLEGQVRALEQAELAAEVSDRTRREAARLRLADRLRGTLGHPVSCHVLGAGAVSGTILAVGPDWLLLEEPAGREALLPFGVLVGVSGLSVRSSAPGAEGAVAARLGLAHALRGIARDRSPVALTCVDTSTVHGTVDRVGADFLELAQHGAGEARRAGAVRGVRAVPLAAVAVLRRAGEPGAGAWA
jgi:hypothetical protein